jgi:hypothetical protein
VGAQIVGKVKLEVEYIPFKAGAEAKAAMARRLSRRMSRSKINAEHKGVLTVHLVKATNLAVRRPFQRRGQPRLGRSPQPCVPQGRLCAWAGCAGKPEFWCTGPRKAKADRAAVPHTMCVAWPTPEQLPARHAPTSLRLWH